MFEKIQSINFNEWGKSAGFHVSLLFFFLVMLKPVTELKAQQTYTSLEELIAERKETMPGRDSEAYIQPGQDVLDRFESAFLYLIEGDHNAAIAEVEAFNYELAWLEADGLDEPIPVLLEKLPVSRGWGTYIYNPGYTNNSSIQIPHPLFDIDTPEMGVKLFNEINPRWYIMAGTHRYANEGGEADMSHNENSVFQIAHTISNVEWTPQLHGFNDQNPIYDGYPEIIISNGTQSPHDIQFDLQDSFRARDFTAGVYKEETHDELRLLAATQNVQGQWSQNSTNQFIHLEFSNPIRTQSQLTNLAVDAMQEVFNLAVSVVEEGSETPEGFRVLQNYPNPFNSSTLLQAEIPEAGTAVFTVYDMLGRKLFSESVSVQAPGTYRVRWDAGEYSSGVYIYRVNWTNLQGNTNSATRQMTMIK